MPLRAEVGPRDMASDSVFVGRRDRPAKEKQSIPKAEFVANITALLDEIQSSLFERASAHRAEHTRRIDSKEEFYEYFTAANTKKPEIHGGFALSHWNGEPAVERQIKDDLNVTIRVIPQGDECEEGRCIISGEPSRRRVVFAKSY